MASFGSEAILRVEQREAGVAAIVLSRPTGPNVIDEALCNALHAACGALFDDETLHAVLLQAEGPTFCVGADLADLQAHAESLPDYVGGLIDRAHAAVLALRRIPVPVIACIHAVAAGGGFSLAMACDQVLAAVPARFVSAYPALGASPDCGLTHTLSSRVGVRKAQALVLDTRPLDVHQALALGIVDEIADDAASLSACATDAARRLCTVPRPALAQAKALFLEDELPTLTRRLFAEKTAFMHCAGTPEFRARVSAFGRPQRHG